ncbi:type II secretion system F family protein [Gehongia tenuis]|uniref:Type II secretion system F family protein n=1 Tax=Gehongia tenuis TaxID=2763655 RepID=A0A926D5J3_9FIRM|nr:type II secretion system F family protein [Gehongia tenuis]MBC8532021.1 type II secretion system F family protein [Gehongia tenuis]
MKKRVEGYRLTQGETAILCENLAMMLHAGIQLRDGFHAVHEDLNGGPLKDALNRVDERIQRGESLADSLKAEDCAPKYMIATLEVGESSGRLEEALEGLGRYYRRMDGFQKRLRSAVYYPVLLICMMAVVVAVMIIGVLPAFQQVLSEFEGGAVSLQAGYGLSYILLAVIALVLLGLAAGFLCSRTEKGRQRLTDLLVKSIFTRRIAYTLAVSQMVNGLSMMLKSGISIEESVAAMILRTRHPRLRERLEACQRAVQEGESWETALGRSGMFGAMGNRLVYIGLKTGSLDLAMEKLSDYYDEELSEALERSVSLVEPVLVVTLSVIIGGIVISAMLPLISILSSVG